jgi:hypothetical protein
MYQEIYHRVLRILIAGSVADIAAVMTRHSVGSSLTSGFIVSDDETPMTNEDEELLLLTLPHTASKYCKKKIVLPVIEEHRPPPTFAEHNFQAAAVAQPVALENHTSSAAADQSHMVEGEVSESATVPPPATVQFNQPPSV